MTGTAVPVFPQPSIYNILPMDIVIDIQTIF